MATRKLGSVTLAGLVDPQRPSQREIAEALGVSQQSVSGWVTGRMAPSMENAFKLERLFGIPHEQWLQDAPESEQPQDSEPEAEAS